VKDPELLEQYERDLEMLTRVSHALPGALREAAELAYPLRAASYDTEFVTGGRSVIWCWTHQREVHRCQRNDMECTGEPVTVSDPTGEAAVTPGRVSLARQEIEQDLHAIHRVIERLVFNSAYLTRTPESHREARQREDERRDLAGENDARCRSCERTEVAPGVRRSEPVHRRTDGGGVYAEITPLCSWCYRFVFDTERTPTVEELEKHHRGEKVRRKAS
jgi:hypothetical protein